jgi:hypothetical protein
MGEINNTEGVLAEKRGRKNNIGDESIGEKFLG